MFITVSGISGAGKTTLIKNAIANDNQLVIPPSVVTRTRRIDDNPEHFIYMSTLEFEKQIAANNFLEYQKYRGNYYGFLKDSYSSITNDNKVAIRDVAYIGVVEIKKQIEEAPNILVMTDFDLIYKRLIKRGDNIDTIATRINALKEEEEKLKEISDYIIDNNSSIEDSNEQFMSIIKTLKRR